MTYSERCHQKRPIGKKGQNKGLLEEYHGVELTADLGYDEDWVIVRGHKEGVGLQKKSYKK